MITTSKINAKRSVRDRGGGSLLCGLLLWLVWHALTYRRPLPTRHFIGQVCLYRPHPPPHPLAPSHPIFGGPLFSTPFLLLLSWDPAAQAVHRCCPLAGGSSLSSPPSHSMGHVTDAPFSRLFEVVIIRYDKAARDCEITHMIVTRARTSLDRT